MLDLTVRSFSTNHGARQDISGVIQASRNTVVVDAGGSIPLLPLDLFFETILPSQVQYAPEPTAQAVPKILELLINGRAYSRKKQRWQAFPKDPKDTTNEGSVYQGFIRIATSIERAFKAVYALDKKIASTTQMVTEPNKIPVHAHRDNKTRPDGIFVLRKRTMPSDVHWVDVVACGEFKRESNVRNLNDDVDKALWSLHHLMREDPRRRFAFAFTVENRTTRLLFCNRSQFAISEPFDFVLEPERLIHSFLTFMFASEAELGFDTTMQRVIVDKKPQYDITVTDSKTGKTSVYRTLELLSNAATFSLRGRGTRVWRARRLENGKLSADNDVAIRDNWIDDDRAREVDVLEEIIADVPEDHSGSNSDDSAGDNSNPDRERSRNELRKYLLNVLASWDVVIDGKRDTTLRVYSSDAATYKIRQDDTNPAAIQRMESKMVSHQSEVKNHHYTTYDALPVPDKDDKYRYHVKAHHRIVYAEIGTPLNYVTSLADALWYLRKTVRILQLVHSAGWVHRDISGGNILIVGNMVKLTDFEYAKRCSSDVQTAGHDVRTGTDAFMSVEVEDQDYQFTDIQRSIHKNVTNIHLPNDDDDTLPVLYDNSPNGDQNPFIEASQYPWRYNPLHDMESVWWLSNHFVFDKDVELVLKSNGIVSPAYVEAPADRLSRLSEQNEFCAPIFRYLNGQKRMKLLSHSTYLSQAAQKVLHPSLRGGIAAALEMIRRSLVDRYRSAEENLNTIDHTVAQGLYDIFRDSLATATASANRPSWFIKVSPLAGAIQRERIAALKSVSHGKRALEEDDEEAHGTASRASGSGVSSGGRKKVKKA